VRKITIRENEGTAFRSGASILTIDPAKKRVTLFPILSRIKCWKGRERAANLYAIANENLNPRWHSM
jgi:hypothetical protein